MPTSLSSRLGRLLAPRAGSIAPGPTAKVVHRALARAISGVGPLDGAEAYAAKALAAADGDVAAATKAITSHHVRLAGTGGFATNLGGLVTLTATVPANIAGLALIQCRMVAAIAAVNGHDVHDDAVRNAVLASILGRSTVEGLVRSKHLPGTPRQIAAGATGQGGTTRPGETELDRVVAAQVAAALITSVLGKRVATTVGKRVPLVGGLVGAATDARATHRVAAYARSELGSRSS